MDKKYREYIEIYLDGHLPRGMIPPPQEHIEEYYKENVKRIDDMIKILTL